ncbi:CRTAC1 family protein [Catenovulum sediminis]|uniref:CRTAC1 family protein n=1 Tax=Catenovulum sediminis TaxID=1740262 RepID=A0ABV1RCY0_9ALTE
MIKLYKPAYLTLSCLVALLGCQTNAQQLPMDIAKSNHKINSQFVDAGKDFQLENKNLRKWDVATVADLDQDGYPDLLLNDHGFSLKVMWNNKGKYAKPYDLIMGDMHGLSAADFDKDGNIELVIARGGGSGSNARNSKIFRFDKQRNITSVSDFDKPLAFMRGRTVKWVDLDQDGWLDLINFAFPSIEMKGASENYLYANDRQGQLVEKNRLPKISKDGQKTLITDFNSDGSPDLLLYGNGAVKAYQAQSAYNYEDVSEQVLPISLTDVTSINEIDYDNDGDFDLVITRGKELEAGESYFNQQKQLFGYFWKRGVKKFAPFKAGDVIEFINLQSQWPTKDLLIGESAYAYQFPGETHSGRDVRLVNSDALGFPDELTEKGTYIGYIGNRQWRLGTNLWSPGSGVIKGVEFAKENPGSPGLKDLIFENRQGKFVDVTDKLGIDYLSHTTSTAVADINNDGYQDIMIVQRGNLVSSNPVIVYLNQQGQSFKQQSMHGLVTEELGAIGLGIEPVDYNLDGFVDILIGHERGKWHLFKNTQTTGHYIQIQVGPSPNSKAASLGAVVKLFHCNKQQVKRVGSTSAAYSLSSNPVVHFGVGECSKNMRVSVQWSNGEIETKFITSTNQLIKI